MESIRDLPELMQRLGRRFTFSLHLPQFASEASGYQPSYFREHTKPGSFKNPGKSRVRKLPRSAGRWKPGLAMSDLPQAVGTEIWNKNQKIIDRISGLSLQI